MKASSPFDSEVDTVRRMRDEGRFGDVVIYAWATVETYINAMLLQQFDLFYLDTRMKGNPRLSLYKEIYQNESNLKRAFAKIDYLLEPDFEEKYTLLKAHELFTEDEKEAITAFQNKRNHLLFHGDLYTPNPVLLSESEKNTIMENAIAALSAAYEASLRMVFGGSKSKSQNASHPSAVNSEKSGAT
jgi:hypothetical protein